MISVFEAFNAYFTPSSQQHRQCRPTCLTVIDQLTTVNKSIYLGVVSIEVDISDVNKAISIKAKAKASISKAKAKDYQFVSRPGQGQGRACPRPRPSFS